MTILLLLYFGFILPYLVGRAWNRVFPIRQSNIGITTAHGMGMLVLFAIFYVASFVPMSRGMGVTELAHWMKLLGFALGVVALAVVNVRLWKDFHVERVSWPVACVAVILLLLSVLVLRPENSDITGEVVRRMTDTNVFYRTTPYGTEPFVGSNHSPIEAIYGIGAVILQMDAVVMLHRITPLVLLVAYFGIYLEIAILFWGNHAKAKQVFLLFVMGLLFIETLLGGSVLHNVLCNPWNGQTLLGSAVLPMAFAVAYHWLRTKRWQCILFAGCLLVAAQLCYGDGAIMVVFLGGVTLVVSLLRRWMERKVPR